MLSKSDTDITNVISRLQSLNISASFVVPTQTGIKKSILDATFSVRSYLKKHDFHDYDTQEKGTINKKIKKCFFITQNKLIETSVSLYRPETKLGDPRIWFYSLSKYANQNNLLALIIIKSDLYILNCSDQNLLATFQGHALIKNNLHFFNNKIFDELLKKMVSIYKIGFIKSVGIGNKGIGETLEFLLDIKPNANKNPDYKGIELKSSRSSKNRSNLFSLVPNWKLSRLKGTKHILNEHGYFTAEKNRIDYNNTLKANIPNSQKLLLRVDEENNLLKQNCILQTGEINDVIWLLSDLKDSLMHKHRQSFWVKADATRRGGHEYFNYKELIYTHSPNPDYFVVLLEAGIITVDYVMHFRENGVARDHGYLFKILPKNLNKLFPEPKYYDLSELG